MNGTEPAGSTSWIDVTPPTRNIRTIVQTVRDFDATISLFNIFLLLADNNAYVTIALSTALVFGPQALPSKKAFS